METVIALYAAALALMGSPGPATLSCAAAGAAYGVRAMPYVLGITLGTSTVIVLVATGLTGVLMAIPGVAPVVAAAAGTYILYLAWKIANAPPVGALNAADNAPPWYAAYGMAIANPKAYGAMGALFSGFVVIPSDPVKDAAVKAVMLAPVALGVNMVWMLTGRGLARMMRDPQASRILNVTFAVMLVISVMLALML